MTEHSEETPTNKTAKASAEAPQPVTTLPKKRPALFATGIVVGALALMGLGIGGGILIEQGLDESSIASPSL